MISYLVSMYVYVSKNYALTFFCQYAGLFDIYESFVVDEKEVRSKIAMG